MDATSMELRHFALRADQPLCGVDFDRMSEEEADRHTWTDDPDGFQADIDAGARVCADCVPEFRTLQKDSKRIQRLIRSLALQREALDEALGDYSIQFGTDVVPALGSALRTETREAIQGAEMIAEFTGETVDWRIR